MSVQSFQDLRENLLLLRDALPALRAAVTGEAGAPDGAWHSQLTRNLLPAIDFDQPVLLVAICGGGSTGKSTLFNALAGKRISSIGFRAGLTSRVLLAGHPRVLRSADLVQGLLHRLRQAPEPWKAPQDSTLPGAPLYALSEAISPSLLLIDTPDFDTGMDGRMVNRERAEPVLRTAEVIVYIFTNTVYNNLSNARFMADIVGGIGGRPTVLVYRISRTATDEEVLQHCRVVAQNLYRSEDSADGLPSEVIGVYRMHESDRVAEGRATPTLAPVGDITRGRPLEELLADLDVAAIKRHVFAADLQHITAGARGELEALQAQVQQAALFREALRQAMAEEALHALRAFPADEAIALATRLFVETSPPYVRLLRGVGSLVAAPLRLAQRVGQGVAQWASAESPPPEPPDLRERITRDLLLGANRLRNRLMDDTLIIQVSEGDPLLTRARAIAVESEAAVPFAERLPSGTYNLHVPVPRAVRSLEPVMLAQDWEAIVQQLRVAAQDLVGLPPNIEVELRRSVAEFRAGMHWTQRLRESFFASLTALPPLLGVTYTLLTADPVSGTGIWIRLQSVLGINDLWALVSIPASAGLGEQERKQLQGMIEPVFRLWLQRRLEATLNVYERTVAAPLWGALASIPDPDDPRFDLLRKALAAVEGAR